MAEGNGNDRIRVSQAANFACGNHRAHGLLQHAEQRLNIFCVNGLRFEVHGDYDVRAHLANHVGGEIVHQTAIDIDSLAVVHGGEGAGD